MTDISKIDMERINGLLDKFEEISNSISSINSSISSINSNIDSINSKLNSMKYVVETWQEGTEWYRVWSDGWIEQGGQIIKKANPTDINLIKQFSNNNYYFNGSFDINSSSRFEKTIYVSKELNKISIYMGSYNAQISNTDTTYINWYACGY